MTDKQIHEQVCDRLRDPSSGFALLEVEGTPRQQYALRTANRLLRARLALKKHRIDKADFELALRDYLMLFKMELPLVDYRVSPLFETLGLVQNAQDQTVWVNAALPSCVNERFVRTVFSQEGDVVEESDQTFPTNRFIRELTGFSAFKSEEQKLVVTGALLTPKGYTTLISMSTGGGKSLITQTVSYQEEGLTVIVVPTVSLMLDQVRTAKDILKTDVEREVFCYHSKTDPEPLRQAILAKTARMLFISPEALIKNAMFKELLAQANREQYLKNLIVDEAHIISEWGASFRTDFQCLEVLRKGWIRENETLRTFLLSATFNRRTVRQLQATYAEDGRWLELRCDALREEIHYDVIRAANPAEKRQWETDLILHLPHPMVVYVNRPSQAEELQQRLRQRGITNTRTFTGQTGSELREQLIEEWIDDQFPIMIATCAFGVGVDKKDVRTVLHLYTPENPGKYYQEAGRGGRDGLPCLSTVLYTADDLNSAFRFTSKVLTTEKLAGRWFSMLSSPYTIRKAGRIVRLCTSVRPDYIEQDDTDDSDWGNSADVNWNICAILLLCRAGLIELLDLEFADRCYYFTAHILCDEIAQESAQAVAEMEAVRDAEWKQNEREYRLMERALKGAQASCLSEMFNEVYPLTAECCAGCNAHDRRLITRAAYPLHLVRSTVVLPPAPPIPMERYMGGSHICLCFAQESERDIQHRLHRMGVNGFVGFDPADEDDACDAQRTFWQYREFFRLAKGNPLFLHGCVAVKCPDDPAELGRVLTEASHLNSRVVLVSHDDVSVPSHGKMLSELVNGPCLQLYVLEDAYVS